MSIPQHTADDRKLTPIEHDEIDDLDLGDLGESFTAAPPPDAAPAPAQDAMLAALPSNWFDTELPPREFVFEGRIPLDAITLLAAAGGSGKSTLALELAASAATGRALLDRFKPSLEGPSRVAVVSIEDDREEVWRRLQRVARAFRLNFDRRQLQDLASNLRVFCPSSFCAVAQGLGGVLVASNDLKRLKAELAEFAPRLVVFDPLAAMLGGVAEENSNDCAQRVLGVLRDAMPPGCGLLVCAHMAKSDRAIGTTPRGAGAWSDGARQVITLRPPDEKEARTLGDDAIHAVALAVVKSNYSALTPWCWLMKSRDSETPGVLREFDFTEYQHAASREKLERLGDAVVDALAVAPCTLQEAKNTGTEAGDRFRDALEEAGHKINRRDFAEIFKALEQAGAVQIVKHGKRMVYMPASDDAEGIF